MQRKAAKSIYAKIIPLTFLVPISLIFVSGFVGLDPHSAFHKGLSMFTEPFPGAFIWTLLLLFNGAFFVYLHPIAHFYADYAAGVNSSPILREKAAKRLNNLQIFTLTISFLGFFFGGIIDSLMGIFYQEMSTAFFFIILESSATGFLCGVIVLFNIENQLFKAKQALLSSETELKQRYQSFYHKIFLTISAIVCFLVFQIFDSLGSFALVGREITDHIINKYMEGDTFFSESIKQEGLKGAMKVFLIRILMIFIYIAHLLRQIKWMIKNPLATVREKLTALNSGQPELTKEIDIIVNDEFSTIYSEINKLIARQMKELKRSEEQLEDVVVNAPDPIISFDENGDIHVFNPAAEEFFGYSGEEMTGSKIFLLFELSPALQKSCNEDSSVFVDFFSSSVEELKRFTGIRKDGEKVHFEASLGRTEIDEDTVIHTAILRDITSQLEFEENLKRAKTAAENANKMKSEFLANMSHELRTPLNAVLGFTQLLSGDKNLTQGQMRKITTISRSGEHLLALINDILDISKIEAGKIEMHETIFDLVQFVEDIKEMFQLKCEKKGLSFYVEYVGKLPRHVSGDLGKLRQILINIIGNAVKFTEEGGIGLITGFDNGKIRFSVRDTGKGIPAGDIEKILQPFTQSSNINNEGGTGLGLAITSRFIEMMGGHLEIESAVGRGSSFSFSLPLEESDDEPEAEESLGTVVGIKGHTPIKVLVVDDKVNNRLILKEMLERVGFITMEAENGKVALERAEEFGPEIVFMDIKMPVMDGYEAVKILKDSEKGATMQVFALTASAFKHDEARIAESGFNGFLAKPFKQTSLFNLIAEKTSVEFEYVDAGQKKATETSAGISLEDLNFAAVNELLTEQETSNLADMVLINDFAAIKNFASVISSRKGLKDLAELLINLAGSFDDAALEKVIDAIQNDRGGSHA